MSLRTVSLPTELCKPWDDMAWPSKAPGDELHYLLDATKWLTDAGETIAGVEVSCSQGLTVADEATVGGKVVILQLTGGTAGTLALVRFRLALTNQDVKIVTVALPIEAETSADLVPAWPPAGGAANDNTLSVGGVQITVAGIPIAI